MHADADADADVDLQSDELCSDAAATIWNLAQFVPLEVRIVCFHCVCFQPDLSGLHYHVCGGSDTTCMARVFAGSWDVHRCSASVVLPSSGSRLWNFLLRIC